ncbi:MAG: MATE family efflux transporter [Eubacteriales bacterium]|nr:MATE family efflux transporter [Eubacteriales bacterium]
MNIRDKKYTIDMTTGPILGKLLRFILPLALSGMLQLFYNAADIIVVGRYAGSTSLAAVGSTGALVNLLVNLFVGLSVGASVITAQYFGARRDEDVSETVHTAMLLGLIGGVIVGVIGLAAARPLLHLMASPDDVIDLSALYLRIIFLGMPAQMIYNFGSSILRAVGDTRRPLYFLAFSGAVNVLLNLLFVIVFDMDVAGVALATIISQILSALLVVQCLMRSDGSFKLRLHGLCIKKDKLFQLIRIGLPAGLQGIVFSLSNMLIQSSVNSFGSVVMAGNAAAGNLEGFIYNAQNSVYQGALTFTGQNVGAKKYERISRICLTSLLTVSTIGIVMGLTAYAFGPTLLGIYDPDPNVISYGMIRLRVFGYTYFLCGVMEVFVGMLRGMGCSFLPMVVSLLGSCVLRIIWIYTVFAVFHTLNILYISYPISWLITAGTHFICYLVIRKRLIRRAGLPSQSC